MTTWTAVVAKFHRVIMRGYPVTAEGLACFRIWYATTYLVVFLPSYRHVGELPDILWDAPDISPHALFLNGFPSTGVLVAIEIALTVSLIALALGFHTPLSSVLVGVLAIIGDGFVYAAEPIAHLILLPLVALIMPLAGWGKRWSLDSLQASGQVQMWPISLFTFIVGLYMFSGGIRKLAWDWLDPSTHASAAVVVRRNLEQAPFAVSTLLSAPRWLLESIDWITVLLEVGLVFAFFVPTWFRRFLAVLAIFHLAIALTLGITFLPNLIAYSILLSWDRLSTFVFRARRVLPPFAHRATVWARDHRWACFALVTGSALLIGWLTPLPLTRLHRSGGLEDITMVLHAAAALFGLGYLMTEITRRFRGERDHTRPDVIPTD